MKCPYCDEIFNQQDERCLAAALRRIKELVKESAKDQRKISFLTALLKDARKPRKKNGVTKK